MKRNSLVLLIVLHAVLAHAGEIRQRPLATSAGANVRDFGAVGDGKADDTEAFQHAVDSGRGDVFVPRGVYRLTKTITADLDRVGPLSITGTGTAKIIMAGPGPAIKLVGTHAGTADPNTVKENVWQNQRMPVVSGLEIVGADPGACGVEATGTMKATLSKLAIRKALHGIHVTNRNRNVIISDCHIYENRGIGIYLDQVNLHQINVGNSHVSYNAGGGIVQRGGDVRNLQIGNCDIEANMGEKAPPAANVLIDATGGAIGEIAITGCTLQHEHNTPDSANIRIIGEGVPQPYAESELRGGNITITGNVLSDVQVNIHLRKVRGVTIIGNTLWQGYAHDLLIEDSSSIAIGANNSDRNPRYHYSDGAKANAGLVFRNCSKVALTGLQINNVWRKEAGLVLENCRYFSICGCVILDCDGCGVLMDDVQDSIVSGCTIGDTRGRDAKAAALVLKKGKDNLITGNILIGKLDVAPDSAKLVNNVEK